MEKHDIIIIGGGPAGLTAGIYLARRRAGFLLLEGTAPGGQLAWAGRIDNYPGFPGGIDGPELAGLFLAQFEKAGGTLAPGQVTSIEQRENGLFSLNAGSYLARSVIVASGNRPARLGVPGEEALTGRGVSYCAVCDGPLFRGRAVAVVGRGPRFAHEAAYLSGLAGKTYLIPLGGKAPPAGGGDVEILAGRRVLAVLGEGKVSGLRLADGETGAERELPVDGVFICAGSRPATDFLPAGLELSPQGYVRAGESTETGLPGLFACGDCREQPLRQVVSACAGGAAASQAAAGFVRRGR